MTLREQFKKEHKWIDSKEQPMFMSVKYVHWLEAKIKQLQEERTDKLTFKQQRDELIEALNAISNFRYETDSQDAKLLAGWAEQALVNHGNK